MTITDITLAAFTFCKSFRALALRPQVGKVAGEQSGAEAVPFATWALFLLAHTSAMAYALLSKRDWTMAAMLLANAVNCGAILLTSVRRRLRHRLRRPLGGQCHRAGSPEPGRRDGAAGLAPGRG